MHMGDLRLNIIAIISALAATVPVAAGAALAMRYKGIDGVAFSYFGDGSTSRGDWHEGVNFASVQKLPVVFVCNNNQYAYSTPLSKQMACANVADRGSAYGIPAEIVQTCGVDITGTGYCWGDDSFGQLGALPSLLVERCGGQVLPCATKPVGVIGRQKFVEISTGFGSHTCGVTTRGNLYCWGLGQSGQRGDGTEASAVATPALVVEPSRLAGSSQ
jgi:hypothetical protein